MTDYHDMRPVYVIRYDYKGGQARYFADSFGELVDAFCTEEDNYFCATLGSGHVKKFKTWQNANDFISTFPPLYDGINYKVIDPNGRSIPPIVSYPTEDVA